MFGKFDCFVNVFVAEICNFSEFILLEIACKDNTKLTVGVFYRSPSSTAENEVIIRDQPNSQRKMRDFTGCFRKYAQFHGKFTEGVSEIHEKIYGPHRRYFEVLC